MGNEKMGNEEMDWKWSLILSNTYLPISSRGYKASDWLPGAIFNGTRNHFV